MKIHILSQYIIYIFSFFSLDLLVLVLVLVSVFLVLVSPLLLPLLGISDDEEGGGHLNIDLPPDFPVSTVGLRLPLLTLGQALT